MLAIRGGYIVCAEWSNVRRFEHFLYLLNLVNDALNVHASQYLTQARQGSNGCPNSSPVLGRIDGRAVQEMTGTELLFANPGSLAKSPVRPGHIYLLHITDGHDPSFHTWVKLLIVSYAPGDSVTVRWQRLDGRSNDE